MALLNELVCFSLRSGTIVAALTTLLTSILFYVQAVLMLEARQYFWHLGFRMGIGFLSGIFFFISLIILCLGLLLIVAIQKKNPKLILPWLIGAAVFETVASVSLIIVNVIGFHRSLLVVPILLVFVYLMFIVHSFYLELKAEKRNESKL